MRDVKILILALSFVVSLIIAGGCAGMNPTDKAAVRADVLAGLQIVAAGVAGMPGADPVAEYWAKYAAGVLAKANPTNP